MKNTYCTTFILTSQSKSKSKHSNLFKKKSKSKQTRRTNAKQKLYNVEPIQAVLWVIMGHTKCLYGRWHIYGQQNKWFLKKLDKPFAKWPIIKSLI